MKIQVAEVTPFGSPVLIAIVATTFTDPLNGPSMLERVQLYFRLHPIMLVSIQENGYRAYATFETHILLALIQLEFLDVTELDLSVPPADPDDELPF